MYFLLLGMMGQAWMKGTSIGAWPCMEMAARRHFNLGHLFQYFYEFVHSLIWCCDTFYFGPGPCNFRRILISHFLESVFEGKRTFRVGFGHHFHGWPKPHLFALKYSP